jgi:tetratricopeptide (TPR) repeat protein
MKKIHVALLFGLLLICACSPDRQLESLFLRADSLLMEQPDSALQLLRTLPATQKLSRRESAHYALLLARATDKCEKPLLPCDSLLDIALHYYDNDEKERAVALLYKGRLEVEMEQSERAINYLQEGLTILKDFPKEIEMKKHTLNSLGNLYSDFGYYEEAIKMYRQMYSCCMTDKDKSIALNAISLCCYVTNEEDSAIAIQQQALEYALASGSSPQIAASELNLSLEYEGIEEIDSALYYARAAVNRLPKNNIQGNYYGNLGSLLLEKGEDRDSAIYYLNKSLEDSTSINGKATTLLDLYKIEKEQKNYQAASAYLEKHVAIIDSLSSIEQSTSVQQLIHEYNTKIQIREEQIKSEHLIQMFIASFILCCFFIILFYQYRINKRKRIQLIYQQTIKQAQSRISSLQTIIEENENVIAFIQQKHEDLKQEQENKTKAIQEREHTIKRLYQEKQELRNWLFAQSDIYKKIALLSKQEVTNKKEMKVLTTPEQTKLKNIIFEIYFDYITDMQKKYPKVTEEDLLYLCLNEAKLLPATIALCFGYTNTHPINQRKSRMKEKMEAKAE